MRKSIADLLLTTLAVFAFPAGPLGAAVIPPNLPPGSQYQLVFVTAGSRDATSSNIADYNAFVGAQAALNPLLPADGTLWHAVAATTGVNAPDNAPSGGLPVYNTQGIEVAPAATGLYAFNLLNPIGYDQFGNATNATAWTGMASADGLLNLYPLGAANNVPGFDVPASVWGFSGATDEGWAAAGFSALTFSRPLYALSTPITVMPEPSCLTLAALALIGLAAGRWRRMGLRFRYPGRAA